MDASRHDTTGCAIKKRSNDLFFKNRYPYTYNTINPRIIIAPVVIFSSQKQITILNYCKES